MGKVENVMEAATQIVASSRIHGRGIVIGPKVNIKTNETGEWKPGSKDTSGGSETAPWEAYADDWEDVRALDR